MKVLFQSILFIVIVFLFALTTDRLNQIEQKSPMGQNTQSGRMDDREFLSDVIAHHEGAIAMAYVALTHSSRPEIIDFANTVITMEKKNIDAAYTWRRDWYGDEAHIFIDKIDPKITMIKDLGEKDSNFDARFLKAMIEHHEGAIKMLSEILVPTAKPEIHSMATSAIAGLSQDIIIMKQWLKEWYE